MPGYRNPAIILGIVSMLDSADGPIARRTHMAGFTLVELMVTLVVAAVVLGIAVPNFTGLVNSSRLTAQANELVTGVQLARSEAIRLNRQVRFCGSQDGTNCLAAGDWAQWIVVRADTNELLHSGVVNPATRVYGDDPSMDFRSDGLARLANGTLANITMNICMPVSRPVDNIRQLNVTGGSRTNVASASGQGDCP